MKKIIILGLVVVVGLFAVAFPTKADTTYYVNSLSPIWDSTGVYAAYYGPNNNYHAVSPGHTEIWLDDDAGIIKAGLTADPVGCGSIGEYCDEGLFAFEPKLTTDNLGTSDLSYVVVNQFGDSPVWMTIEFETGDDSTRNDNATYECVPKNNPKEWHEVDATNTGWCTWNQWKTDANGDYDGTEGTAFTIQQMIDDAKGESEEDSGTLNVIRVYLRLGMGISYHDNDNGTVAWVDKVTIGEDIYDFVVNPNIKPLKDGNNYEVENSWGGRP